MTIQTLPRVHVAPAVRLDQVSVAYGSTVVLDTLDLEIDAGQMIGLIGPNGAGKTTLLKTIVGALKPTRGTIDVLGQRIGNVRQRVAYVPQRRDVDWSFPITVSDVVLMGRYGRLGIWRRPSKQDRDIALQALEQVGLAGRRHCQIGELSGGQQQRVFVARALAQDADLLLLDEPFTGIDTTTQGVIFSLLYEQRQRGRTVLLSTHDLHSVEENCDQLVALNRTIVAAGPVDHVFTPPVLRATFGAQLAIVGEREAVVVQQQSGN
jgi:manganese/zinc/iron transport system ATP- binding protein